MKLKRFAFLLFMFFSVANFAKDELGRKNMDISLEAGKLFLGMIPIRISFGLTDRVALGIAAYGSFFNIGGGLTSGFGGKIDAKFYMRGLTYEDGWYIKPALRGGYLTMAKRAGPTFAASVVLGHGWVWSSGFFIDLGLGAQYLHWFKSEDAIENTVGFGVNGVLPAFDVSLGYAF